MISFVEEEEASEAWEAAERAAGGAAAGSPGSRSGLPLHPCSASTGTCPMAFVFDTPFVRGSAVPTATLRFLRPSWAAGRCLGAGSPPGVTPGCYSAAACEAVVMWGVVICSS